MSASSPRLPPSKPLEKLPTGIEGLDEITRGGLPRGRTTVLMGGPGCGKTILALQTLVNGARHYGEPGIFVAFEENTRHIVDNAFTFGWNLHELEEEKLFLLDARVPADVTHAGDFDLEAILAGVGAKAREMGAKRIVFDSVDVLLAMLDNPQRERQEFYRLHDWLIKSGLTGIITAKLEGSHGFADQRYGFLHFMADCAIILNHRIVDHVSLRNLRLAKYRGSNFAENEAPLVIGPQGLDVASIGAVDVHYEALTERVSTGIERLDSMLEGGYFRGATVLIAGAPGTAKSTLCAAFIEAACERGERGLYIGFDENAAEIVRNAASVGIQLAPHIERGLLKIVSMRTEAVSAKEHLLKLKTLIAEQQPRCMVIDPLSALERAGGKLAASGVIERLIHVLKSTGVTAVFTSLLASAEPNTESTLIQISTVADTWIQLSYAIEGGERNRALTIIKSRGTAHSNQVRELLLSHEGVTLANVYIAGGRVLMGALRWEKEQAERAEKDAISEELQRQRREIEQKNSQLRDRIASLQQELSTHEGELQALAQREESRVAADVQRGSALLRLRRSDPLPANSEPHPGAASLPGIDPALAE